MNFCFCHTERVESGRKENIPYSQRNVTDNVMLTTEKNSVTITLHNC
jgi:hypothetical protein